MLAAAQAAAVALAAQHATTPWQWVHVTGCAEAGTCGHLYVDARALGHSDAHELSSDGMVSLERVHAFVEKASSELSGLAERLRACEAV